MIRQGLDELLFLSIIRENKKCLKPFKQINKKQNMMTARG